MWIKQKTVNKQGDTEIKIVWHEPEKKALDAVPITYSNAVSLPSVAVPAANAESAGKTKRLYTWMQAFIAAQMFPGWHLPSNAEWMVLRDYCGGATPAATKLSSAKYASCTDDFGFNALWGGYIRYNDGISRMLDFTGFWWSSQSYYMAYINENLLQISSENAGNYFSVRLIKDS
jgi:uncharacterized protein (TIGR02145 family)